MKASKALVVVMMSLLTVGPVAAVTDKGGGDKGGAKGGGADKAGGKAGSGDRGGGKAGGDKAGGKAGSGDRGGGKAGGDKAGKAGGGDKGTRAAGAADRREVAGGSHAGVSGRSSAPSGHARALDLRTRDTRSESQKTVDRNMANAEKVSKEMQAAKEKEAMRDKTHDPPRVKVGPHASVGAQTNPPGVNVRISTDPPKKDEKKNPPR